MEKDPQNLDHEPVKFNIPEKKEPENSGTPEPEKTDIVMPWDEKDKPEEKPEEPAVRTSYFSKPGKKKAIDETIARFNINEEAASKAKETPAQNDSGPVMVMRRTPRNPERPVYTKPQETEDVSSEEKGFKEKVIPLKGDSKKTLFKKGLIIVISLTVIICAVAITVIYGRIPKSGLTPKNGVVVTEDQAALKEQEEREKKEKEAEKAKAQESSANSSGNTQNSNNQQSNAGNGNQGVNTGSVGGTGQNNSAVAGNNMQNAGNGQTGVQTQSTYQ